MTKEPTIREILIDMYIDHNVPRCGAYLSEEESKNIDLAQQEIDAKYVIKINDAYGKGFDEGAKWIKDKMLSEEDIERIIAEFIPHRDNQYIKPLSTAIYNLLEEMMR